MPLLAVGLAAVAGGTAMQIAGNKESQSAISGARAKEMAQQRQLQAQAGTVFDTSQTANSEPTANSTLFSGVNARAAIANALKTATAGTTSSALPVNQPDYQVTDGRPMATAGARANTAGNAWSNVVGGAANRLGSYNDLATKQGIANQQTDAQLGVISNKARGDANLLPLEIEVASHKGDSLRGWGQIVSALGSVASMGAAAGLGSGAAAGTVSGAQLDALASGYGPVTAGSAAALAPSTAGAWGTSQLAAQPFWAQALGGAGVY